MGFCTLICKILICSLIRWMFSLRNRQFEYSLQNLILRCTYFYLKWHSRHKGVAQYLLPVWEHSSVYVHTMCVAIRREYTGRTFWVSLHYVVLLIWDLHCWNVLLRFPFWFLYGGGDKDITHCSCWFIPDVSLSFSPSFSWSIWSVLSCLSCVKKKKQTSFNPGNNTLSTRACEPIRNDDSVYLWHGHFVFLPLFLISGKHYEIRFIRKKPFFVFS